MNTLRSEHSQQFVYFKMDEELYMILAENESDSSAGLITSLCSGKINDKLHKANMI